MSMGVHKGPSFGGASRVNRMPERVFVFFWRAEGFSGGVGGLKGKLEVPLAMVVLWGELYV